MPDLPRIDAHFLQTWPIPEADAQGDKRSRGLAVCVGGSAELPGAMVLAGTGVLRAGAGTVRLGVPASTALAIGVGLPECLVFSLPETLSSAAARTVAERAEGASALLVGPGVAESTSLGLFLAALLPMLPESTTLILDARALDAAPEVVHAVRKRRARTILTPHAGEMARLLEMDRAAVEEQPLELARCAADRFQAVVVLKRARTLVVSPDTDAYEFAGGNVGLATSGSGDTLAGIITGLAARGAEPVQAAAWGVYLHGTAGERLRQRIGRVGYLARELLDEVPRLVDKLSASAEGSIRP